MANEAVRLRPCGLRRDEQDFSSLSAVALREGGTQKAQPFLPCHGVIQWSRDIFTKNQEALLACPAIASATADEDAPLYFACEAVLFAHL